MGRFRALRPLQASGLGLIRPDQGEASVFEWSGSIIGWYVEPLDDDAKAMVAARASELKKRGISEVEEDKNLPTSPFPQGVLRAHAGMSAPGVVGGTLAGAGDTPAPDANAPHMTTPARRRRAG